MCFHVVLVLPRVPLSFFLGRPPLFFFWLPGGKAFCVIPYYFKLREKRNTVLSIQFVLGRVDVQEGELLLPAELAHASKELPRDITGDLLVDAVFLGTVLRPDEVGGEVCLRGVA